MRVPRTRPAVRREGEEQWLGGRQTRRWVLLSVQKLRGVRSERGRHRLGCGEELECLLVQAAVVSSGRARLRLRECQAYTPASERRPLALLGLLRSVWLKQRWRQSPNKVYPHITLPRFSGIESHNVTGAYYVTLP